MTNNTQIYKNTRKEIENQLERIKTALNKMDEQQDLNPCDWGFTGNAQQVSNQLSEILEFIEDDLETIKC